MLAPPAATDAMQAPRGPIEPTGWRRLLARFTVWYSDQNAKFHARRLSLSTAGLLLILAVVQGLTLVAIYAGVRAFGRSPAAPAAEQAALKAPPPAAPKPPPAETASAAAAPVPLRQPDGSGRTVEDCKSLFADNPPHDGFYPGAAQEQQRLGRNAIVHGDLRAARSAYCRAIHWDPKNQEIALQLSQVFLLERDGPKAVEYAERASAIDSTLPRVQEVLGDAYARVGAQEEARFAWFAAARLEPTSSEAGRLLVSREVRQADTALRRRNLVVAEKFFRRAAILEPTSLTSMIGLSYVLIQLDDAKAAAFWARRAVKQSPRNASARLSLGDALHASKDTRAAIAEWREASLLDPANSEAMKRLRRAGVSKN
jgi:tetratricopeptide (TPR) repeat protein